jgi:hypothetical protein
MTNEAAALFWSELAKSSCASTVPAAASELSTTTDWRNEGDAYGAPGDAGVSPAVR